jgi:hypothetical protein
MATARDHVERALRILNVLASGENAQASELADGLTALNGMLGFWSIQGLTIYEKVREVFPLISGQQQYALGPAGDFATARPVHISGIGLVIDDTEYPMDIISQDDWAQIQQKAIQGLPTRAYPEGSMPAVTLQLWPVPNQVYSLAIYSGKPFAAVTAATVFALPPGYDEAIPYNLAQRIAPEYGKALSLDAQKIASESYAGLKRANIKNVLTSSDAFTLTQASGWNWITGGSR